MCSITVVLLEISEVKSGVLLESITTCMNEYTAGVSSHTIALAGQESRCPRFPHTSVRHQHDQTNCCPSEATLYGSNASVLGTSRSARPTHWKQGSKERMRAYTRNGMCSFCQSMNRVSLDLPNAERLNIEQASCEAINYSL